MFSSGYDVEMEQSAVAALERIGAGERFDVVISDLSMPVMSGAELHVRVQAIDSQQADRMLFVTGSGYDEFSRTFLAGLTGRWLQKPFDANALRALVAQLAASRRV